jgi:two-component system, NarL family, invasion response regulator UvrY
VISVQLIDDHVVVRAAMRRLLEAEGGIKVVAESGTVERGLKDYARQHPDVVILDLAFPKGSGLEAAERLCAPDDPARVIILTMYENAVYPFRALKAGAKGYLTKSCPPEELIRAVRAVARGEVYLEPRVAQAMALRPFADEPDPFQVLTDREFDVFRLLAAGQSVKEIAAALCLSPKTVGAHRTRVMRALGAGNVAELARIAIRHGLMTV